MRQVNVEFSIVFPSTHIHVGVKAVNSVQQRVAELKDRVAGFLLVIAKVGKDTEKSLVKMSKDLMEELEELKEYVRKNALLHLFCSCLLEVVLLRLTVVFKPLTIKASF